MTSKLENISALGRR